MLRNPLFLTLALLAVVAAVVFLFSGENTPELPSMGPGVGAEPLAVEPPEGGSGAGNPITTSSYAGQENAARVLGGQVSDREGHPVGPVRVRARLFAGSTPSAASLRDEELMTTDDGRFRWELPASDGAVSATLHVISSEHASQPVAMTLLPGEPLPRRVDLIVEPWRRWYELFILDSGRSTAVSDALVEATGVDTPLISDGAGHVRVPSLGSDTIVRVSHPDYATVRLRLQGASGGSDTIFVSLTRGASLDLQVVDSRGRPLAGVRARVARLPAGVTDAEGRLLITGLMPQPEAQLLSLRHPGHRALDHPLILAAPRLATMRVALARGASLRGRVVDAEGHPLHGAVVALRHEADDDPPSVTTDAHGRFRFDGSGAAGEHLWATYHGLAPELVPVRGARRPIEIRLRSGRSCAGRVIDESGSGVADAQIVAEIEGQGVIHPEVRSDANGHFRFEHLPARALRLVASHYGFLPARKALDSSDDAGTLVMTRGLPLRLSMIFEGRREAQRTLRIAVIPESVDEPAPPPVWSPPGQEVHCGEGRFASVQALLRPDEAYRIEARAPGFALAVLEHYVAPESPEGPYPVLHLRQGATVTGRLVYAGTDDPVRDATLQPAGSSWPSTQSDPVGRFVLGGLPSGPLKLRIGGAHLATTLVEVEAPRQRGSTDLGTLQIPVAGIIAVTVRDSSGNPMAAVRLALEGNPATAGESPREATTDDTGTAHFDGLPPGKVRITVVDGPSELAGTSEQAEVVAGITRFVLLAADAERAYVEGYLLGEVALDQTVTIELEPLSGEDREVRRTPSITGIFNFSDLAPGRYRIGTHFELEGQRYGGTLEIDLTAGPNPITLRVAIER